MIKRLEMLPRILGKIKMTKKVHSFLNLPI